VATDVLEEHIAYILKAFCLPPAFTLVSRSAYFFDPEDGDDMSSETSVDIQRTTRRYIPEDGTLQYYFKFITVYAFEISPSNVATLQVYYRRF
jgi:hypothetical protein